MTPCASSRSCNAVHGDPAHGAGKLPHVPRELHQFGLEVDFDVGVVVNRGLELVEKFLGVRAFQGEIQLPGQAPQGALPFHQVGVKALVRQGQGRAQARPPRPPAPGPGESPESSGAGWASGPPPGRPPWPPGPGPWSGRPPAPSGGPRRTAPGYWQRRSSPGSGRPPPGPPGTPLRGSGDCRRPPPPG